MQYPAAPPVAAWGVRAQVMICRRAGRMFSRWARTTARPVARKRAAMAGTSFSLTLPTRPMPPRITTPTARAVTTPMANRGRPKEV